MVMSHILRMSKTICTLFAHQTLTRYLNSRLRYYVITRANFRTEIFRRYDFTSGRIFEFRIDSYMDLTTCSDNALPVTNGIVSLTQLLFWGSIFIRTQYN